MNYDDIFEAYYVQYRAEAEVPNSTDDEYLIGQPLANEAINRWANYDNTMWKELFTNAQSAGDGDLTIVEGQTEYATPADMKQVGGYVSISNLDGVTVARLKLVEPQEAQFRGDNASYAYFIGDPNSGFTLVINPAPTATWDGFGIDYIYYKQPTKITRGQDLTEMGDPYFIVHRMLANRFRASRNPYYSSAKADAEDALRTMQLTNNSGSWDNPWSLPDRSGTTWGA